MGRKLDEFNGRFGFNDACYDIKYRNGRILCAGTYKPSIKMYDVEHQNIVVERHCAEEIIKCEFVTDERNCALRRDRMVEFYTKAGLLEKIKFKNECYDIKAVEGLLYVAGDKIGQFDMVKGEFADSIDCKAYEVTVDGGVIGVRNHRGLTFYDSRTNERIKSIEQEVVAFDTCGNSVVYSDERDVFELDRRNWNSSKVSVDFSDATVKHIKCIDPNNRIYGGNSTILFSRTNQNEDVGFIINRICLGQCRLFVGGESEQISVYDLD
ncbi:NOL10 [Enterospora canceri]|uniref:NOL10 n=1 Tax=Enterospora canceri TaxID=1081671 RepID=A0A1Y1S757_9MICR|nr:NOL10 [Enterospora canceri]